MKSNEVLVHATMWMNPKDIMLTERSPDTKGQILYNSVYVRCPQKAKSYKVGEWLPELGRGVSGVTLLSMGFILR